MSRNNNKLYSRDVMPLTVAALGGIAYQGLRKAREANYSATHDELTELLNARGLNRRLKRSKDPVAMLYIDADNLKAINDLISHERGDEVIKATADIITRSLRPDDIAARTGGDEFIVILGSKGRNKIRREPSQVAESVRSRMIQGTQALLGANTDLIEKGFDLSVGVAIWEPRMSVTEVKEKAEAHMYHVKAQQHDTNGQYRAA